MINDNFFFIVNSTFQKTTFSCLKKSFYGCSNYPECKFTLAEHFRKKKLTKTNVKELLEGKETLVKGIKNKEKKPYNAVVKIGEKGYIDFISFSK
ncbi:TPA: topoisomerase [Enterococcus faecium]|nr:topoisomerase [Enterococcus faecium]